MSGLRGWGIFIILLIILAVLGGAGWIIQRQYRARRLGIPAPPLNPFAKTPRTTSTSYQPPSPASGGIVSWATSKFRQLTNQRSSAGAYESTSYRSGSHSARRGGFDPLDPDEAWDTRVGNEADYALGPTGGPAGAGPYYEVDGAERGERGRQRELDERYEEEMHGGARGGERGNPFGDGAERSSLEVRGTSPMPGRGGSRRSAFKEDM